LKDMPASHVVRGSWREEQKCYGIELEGVR